jgi:hypothetical protein
MSETVFKNMLGQMIEDIEGRIGDDKMVFITPNGSRFVFHHGQNCCESVQIETIEGDLMDLLGSPLVMAEEVSSEGTQSPENVDSFTWTFYKFATKKGFVTVRWLGTSNGYYSEDVSFYEEVI